MQTGKRLDSWEVAAAILLVEGEMHIDRLTERVVDCGISTLGLRGHTPRQSLCPQLTKRPEVFRRQGRGYYKVLQCAEVGAARIMAAKQRYLEWSDQRIKREACNREQLARMHAVLDRTRRL
jgi:hypothetical protein